jgi:NAD(P)-dependent dehydrogenase (short-subunit alcohol dehydrogenase family)
MRLKGKSSLITGAGSGIGRATAITFAQEGSSVVAADVNEGSAAETVRRIEATGGAAIAVAADVSASADVERLVSAAIDRFQHIDILCNNAGVGSTEPAADTPDEVWDRVFAVNSRGTFLCCKHVLPHMQQSGGGVIVNMAAVAGLIGVKNRAAYCASKAAVISLTRSIAVDYVSQGIRCNCICPATIDSPWVDRLLATADDPEFERASLEARQPMRRLGTTEEIAKAALYLASEDTAFMTGSSLVIDGGWTAQ